jgi:hypothetical protein
MRRIAIALMPIVLAGPALGQPAVPPRISSKPAPQTSWGKAGVSFEQYRADAVTCGQRGYYRDVSDSDAAQAFVKGSRMIDGALQTSGGIARVGDPWVDVARVVQGVRPAARMREVGALLLATVEQCLVGLGYSRFRLTEAQRGEAEKLKFGTPERHAYLHRLASDADILARQRIPPGTPTVEVIGPEGGG